MIVDETTEDDFDELETGPVRLEVEGWRLILSGVPGGEGRYESIPCGKTDLYSLEKVSILNANKSNVLT